MERKRWTKIAGNMAAEDVNVQRTADLADEITDAVADSSGENGLAILRGPDGVVFEVKDGMGRPSRELRVSILPS